MPAPAATKAAIKRAIEATQDAGLTPTAVVVAKDGSVRVETAAGQASRQDGAGHEKESVNGQTKAGKVVTPKKWNIG